MENSSNAAHGLVLYRFAERTNHFPLYGANANDPTHAPVWPEHRRGAPIPDNPAPQNGQGVRQ